MLLIVLIAGAAQAGYLNGGIGIAIFRNEFNYIFIETSLFVLCIRF